MYTIISLLQNSIGTFSKAIYKLIIVSKYFPCYPNNFPVLLPYQSLNLFFQSHLRRLTEMHMNHISGIPNHHTKARMSVLNLIILFHLQTSKIQQGIGSVSLPLHIPCSLSLWSLRLLLFHQIIFFLLSIGSFNTVEQKMYLFHLFVDMPMSADGLP